MPSGPRVQPLARRFAFCTLASMISVARLRL
jgi:hypothetical protein